MGDSPDSMLGLSRSDSGLDLDDVLRVNEQQLKKIAAVTTLGHAEDDEYNITCEQNKCLKKALVDMWDFFDLKDAKGSRKLDKDALGGEDIFPEREDYDLILKLEEENSLLLWEREQLKEAVGLLEAERKSFKDVVENLQTRNQELGRKEEIALELLNEKRAKTEKQKTEIDNVIEFYEWNTNLTLEQLDIIRSKNAEVQRINSILQNQNYELQGKVHLMEEERSSLTEVRMEMRKEQSFFEGQNFSLNRSLILMLRSVQLESRNLRKAKAKGREVRSRCRAACRKAIEERIRRRKILKMCRKMKLIDAKLSKENRSLQGQVESWSARCGLLLKFLKSACLAVEKSKRRCKKLGKILKGRQRKWKRLTRKCKIVKNALKCFKTKHIFQLKINKQLCKEVNELKIEIQRLKGDISLMTEERDNFETRYKEKLTENKNLAEIINSYEFTSEELKERINVMKEQLQKKCKEANVLKKLKEATSEKLDLELEYKKESERKLQEMETEKERLQSQLESEKMKNDSLSQVLARTEDNLDLIKRQFENEEQYRSKEAESLAKVATRLRGNLDTEANMKSEFKEKIRLLTSENFEMETKLKNEIEKNGENEELILYLQNLNEEMRQRKPSRYQRFLCKSRRNSLF